MSIEAVFISNDEGKLLYYRNYSRTLSQFLIEDFAFSLQSNFLKDNQHIFSTHGSHRLVYLPIENCLLVLVTENSSNIVEDVDSIGRMKDVVVNIVNPRLSEETVFDNYLDLTMAFDEMINLKSRILFNRTQITTFLALESANEEIQKKILEEKAQQTKKKNEAEIKQIERMKKVKEMIREEVSEIDRQVKEMVEGLKANSASSNSVPTDAKNESKTAGVLKQKKGMQLGKPVKEKQVIDSSSKKNPSKAEQNTDSKQNEAEQQSGKFNPLNDEVKILLDEKISGQIDSNGNLRKMELKGSLNIMIENDQLGRFNVQTTKFEEPKCLGFRLPPNFDKTAWSSGLLSLKPKSPALPCKTIIETLKYSLTTSLSSDSAPFRVSFWFSGNQLSSEVDFNTSQTLFNSLENIHIRFKKLIAFDFEVSDSENSKFSTNNRYLEWQIPKLNKNCPVASITVNFEESINESSVLPAEIDIDSINTVCLLEVSKVTDENGREIKHSFRKILGAKDFSIEA